MLNIKFYQDASHGWYAVKRRTLERLNVLEQISGCSYQSLSGQTIYLEEDSDATKLFNRLHELNIQGVIIDMPFKNTSHIRRLDKFKK